MIESPSDLALVAAARGGDKDAFGQLIERYERLAVRVARGMLGDEEIAREVAQEAFLTAYLSLEHLREPSRFGSWLYGIVLNLCRSHRRTHRLAFLSLEAMAGGERFESHLFAGPAPDPQEVAEERELNQLVRDAVEALTEADRAATLLFYYEGLSIQEVAAGLGISANAVKGRLYHSRQQLRERLLPADEERTRRVSEQRRKPMVPVKVADVVKRELRSEGNPPFTHYVVVLYDEAGRRALPIWVGPWEGQAIALGLTEFKPMRPLTYAFTANLLEAAGARVEAVEVQTLKEDTFYAIVRLRRGDAVREVDARPSDAIALALRTGSPLYAAEEVIQRGGMDVTPWLGGEVRFGHNAQALLNESGVAQVAAAPDPHRMPTPEEFDKSRHELMDHVFGRPAS